MQYLASHGRSTTVVTNDLLARYQMTRAVKKAELAWKAGKGFVVAFRCMGIVCWVLWLDVVATLGRPKAENY